MNKYFSIGELAKLQNISRQTLIFYDTIGLFKPNFTDPNNGYRYYGWEQLDYLDTICILKKIGLSLNEIKTFMQTYCIDESIAALQTQMDAISAQITNLQLIHNRIQHRIKQLIKAKQISCDHLDSITMTTSQPTYLYVRKVDSPYTLDQVSLATKQCYVESNKKQLPVYMESGAIIPYQNIINGDYTLASHVFLPIETMIDNEDIIYLPANKCITTYHQGNYESIGTSYQRIINYAKQNDVEIISNSYEFAIHDYLTTRNRDEYITQIMFFVR